MRALLFLCLTLCSLHNLTSVQHEEQIYQGWSSTYTRATFQGCFFATAPHNTADYITVISVVCHESNSNPNAVNPDQNLKVGIELLTRLLTKYDNVELAITAYNAGEGNVAKYQEIPPFKVTKNYVVNVIQHYQNQY